MTSRSSRLLIDEAPIAVAPSAARILGLPEAVFLQQLHYRLHQKMCDPETYKSHFLNGRYWVYWTLQDLRKEIPLGKSADPYKRITAKLRELGILLVEKHKQSNWDQTNYYSINYDALDAVVGCEGGHPAIGGVATDRSGKEQQSDPPDGTGSNGGIATDHQTKISPETSTKTTTTPGSPRPPAHKEEIEWSQIPSDIRGKVLELIPGHLDPQRCVDMLAARLARDSFLTEPSKIASPIKWLEKALEDPDFSSADNFASQRRRASARKVDLDLDRTCADQQSAAQRRILQDREDAAAAELSKLDKTSLGALASAAIELCAYPNLANHICAAVSQGHLPEKRLAKLAVLKALKAFAGDGT